MSTPTGPGRNPDPSAPGQSPDAGTTAGGSMLLATLRGSETNPSESALSAKPKRFSSHNTVTALVLFVSAVMLYGMRQAGMRSGMTFTEVKIDYQREEVSPAMQAAQVRILEDLQRSERPVQIPADKLAKNPFELASTAATISKPAGEDQSLAEAQRQAELARQAKAEHLEQIQTALASLHLKSVMEGRVPLARINDQTVRVGDTVGEFFKVMRIDGRSVELSAEGQTFTLEMSESRADPGGAPPTKTGRATGPVRPR